MKASISPARMVWAGAMAPIPAARTRATCRACIRLSIRFGRLGGLRWYGQAALANEPLPEFRYHPDPLHTGSVKPSEETCRCCGQARGYVYADSMTASEDLEHQLCPWCIASGAAAEKFDCEFTEPDAIEGVSDEVVEEVCRRTPGFTCWQSDLWWTHCGDAAAYLGPVGKKELDAIGPEAWAGFDATSEMEGEDLARLRERLDRDLGPTAYLFRCLHCGVYGAPWDSH
ncbi:MAG: CbrC family protein [Fimbriimonas sp.]